MAYKEGKKRGWFSYRELSCLVETIRITAIVQTLVSISSVCIAAYTAGVVTLLGSALIASHIPGTSLAPRSPPTPFNTTNTSVTPPNRQNSENTLNDLDEFDHFPNNLNNQTNFKANFTTFGQYYNHIETQNNSWHWWLSPLSDWLPEYSENDKDYPRRVGVSSQNPVASFVTNSQVVISDHNAWNDFVTEINWKESLNEGLQGSRNSWQYYVELVTKISIGHQH